MHGEHATSSSVKIFANIFISFVGAGVLGLPYAFKEVSLRLELTGLRMTNELMTGNRSAGRIVILVTGRCSVSNSETRPRLVTSRLQLFTFDGGSHMIQHIF